MTNIDITPGSVVVGVDGSQDSVHAIDWAADHAKTEGRPLVLLHAVGNPSSTVAWMASGGIDPTEALEAADAAGHAVLETALARFEDTDDVRSVVVRNDPRTALLDAAKTAGVVVLGSRGRGPVRSLLLGSVSAAVAAHATSPVVVVRPHHPGKVRRGVLVGVDTGPASQPVLEFAFRQAAEKALPLNVMHTVWDPMATVSEPHELATDDPAWTEGALSLAEAIAGLSEKFPEVPVKRLVVRGLPAAGLLALADSMHLVVVGHHRQGVMSRALEGSVALGVLEHAGTVVAVVPHP